MTKLNLTPHHFAISVVNFDETVKWYSEKLGFELVSSFERLGATIGFMKLGELHLEVFSFDESAPLPDYRKELLTDKKVNGIKHFAFAVDDIKEATNILKNKGVEFIQEPLLGGAGHLYAFFVDLNGIMIELFESEPHKGE